MSNSKVLFRLPWSFWRSVVYRLCSDAMYTAGKKQFSLLVVLTVTISQKTLSSHRGLACDLYQQTPYYLWITITDMFSVLVAVKVKYVYLIYEWRYNCMCKLLSFCKLICFLSFEVLFYTIFIDPQACLYNQSNSLKLDASSYRSSHRAFAMLRLGCKADRLTFLHQTPFILI